MYDEDAAYEERLAEQRDEDLRLAAEEDALERDLMMGCEKAGHPIDGDTCVCGKKTYEQERRGKERVER